MAEPGSPLSRHTVSFNILCVFVSVFGGSEYSLKMNVAKLPSEEHVVPTDTLFFTEQEL